MAPHAARFTPSFAGLCHVHIHRCPIVLVGLDGDRLDAISPAFEGRFIKIAGAVIRVHARSMKNLRTQVISKASKTPLVKHQCCAFLSMDAFGLEVNQEVVLGHGFIKHIWSEASEKWMSVFFRCGYQYDVRG
jgi:hypothetical protein